MVRRDGAEARKERIAKIATYIHAQLYQNKDFGYIPLDKTVVEIEFDTGLVNEKIMDILEKMQKLGQIEIDVEKDQIRKASVV